MLKKSFKILGAGICLAFAFAIIIGILNYNPDSPAGTSQKRYEWATWSEGEDTPNADIIVLKDSEVVRNDYLQTSGTIYGGLANNTGRKLSYVQITIGIYSPSGSKISDCTDNVSSLDVAGTWTYNALCTNLPATEFVYKVEDVTYF